MEGLEKVIWILLSFIIPIVVPVLYYLIVVREEKTIIKDREPSEKEIIETIEKLHKLKKEGAITETEFEEKKKNLLNRTAIDKKNID